MRFKSFYGLVFLVIAASFPSYSDEEERAQAAFSHATQVLAEYRNTTNHELLFDADSSIERAWQDYTYHHGMEGDLPRDLAILRARSATARRDKSRVSEAWEIAIGLQPMDLSKSGRLNLNIAAAYATAKVGDHVAAQRYFSVARTYAFLRDKNAKDLQLQLRIQELRFVGRSLEWRKLNDNLMDMRKFSEGFAMWTLPRLEALLGEAEIRLMFEPERDEKRSNLATLKAKIILLTKGMEGELPSRYIDRIRAYYYAIEDGYNL
jgi:hypothetical protein